MPVGLASEFCLGGLGPPSIIKFTHPESWPPGSRKKMILLTGFNPFGDLDVNISELIVESIAERARASGRTGLVTEVLPTEYRRAGDRIRGLIRQFKPDAVLGLGVAAGTRGLRLERVALNLDDCTEPDNSGEVALGRTIDADGPAAYFSTLPLGPLLEALEKVGVPAFISNHAGAFLCNHLFYVARHEAEQSGIPCRCGFIHVPAACGQVSKAGDGDAAMPLSRLVEGIECCLNVLRLN
jgi:pyroglutamyl-peptidase